MKVGRNDPCPCGSGRKYKHCHLRTVETSPSVDLLWQRLHELSEQLPTELLKFAKNQFGPPILDEAWAEFTLYEEDEFDPQTKHMPVFLPWFFYQWLPDSEQTGVPAEMIGDFPIVKLYLQKRGRHENPLTVRYLQACAASAFSFHDVVAVTPGAGMTLRECFGGGEISVIEKSGSRTILKGDIVFANVVSIDHVSVLDGCAPIAFPPLEKAQIIELRNAIKKHNPIVDSAVLKDYDLEMIEIYHETTGRLLNPRLPILQNTDGDPLAFCRVIYEIESPRAAFDALRHLSIDHTEQELLAEATLDADGELLAVEMPWLKPGNAKHLSWQNTALGRIEIDGHRLVVEVNSEERAKAFRAIAAERLPVGNRYKATVVEPVEAALAAHRRDKTPPDADADDLNKLPEVQAMLKEHLRAHYREWPRMKLPALKGKTPVHAMKTAEGREMVEALLLDLERREAAGSGIDQEILSELRAALSGKRLAPQA